MINPKPVFWTVGDWNALFGYGSNLLVNVLTLTSLLQFVVGVPADIVYGRVLPAFGLMMFLSACYYSFLAYRLAQQENRSDVCALPSGPGIGHMFIVTFVVMLPIKILTGDVIKAWEAGMAWVFLQSLVIICCGYAGHWIRRITPRAALLSALAGIAMTYIAIRPIAAIYATPLIGLVCLAIVLLNWVGQVRFFRGIPAGLIIIAVGTLIAWSSNLVGLNLGGLSLQQLTDSFVNFGFQIPIPAVGHLFSGFEFLGLLLVTALPFGVYDVIEAIDNIESAEREGDSYPTHKVLFADGIISMIGCLLGNPFMLVVYIGHPGWKAMGGRIGYCAGSGALVFVLCIFGIVPVMLSAIPIVAVYPILLFIAMLIGSQAFNETPKRHAPAVVLGILPHLAHWGNDLVLNTLNAVGNVAITPELIARLEDEGILFQGLEVLGDGPVLTGVVLSAAAVFIIERQLQRAAFVVMLGAILTWVGFMHSPELGIGQSPMLALAYAVVAATIFLCDKFCVTREAIDEASATQDLEPKLDFAGHE